MIEGAIQFYLEKHNFNTFNLKAVLFDMDGVLYDSMRHHSEAWVKAMIESGLPFTHYDAYINEGRTGTATINSVFVKLNGREAAEDEKQAIYALKSKYFEELGEPIQMPYAYDILKKLKAKGLKIMVVTGSAQPLLIESLTLHFPDMFTKDDVISAFDVSNGKPHPEPYLKALERAGIKPWEAVVIENAPMGVLASSTAQIFTIGVNTGPLEPVILTQNGANIVLLSMKELFEKWDEFHFEKTYKMK
ncbi:HAD-superfamily hydrolase, subfamily IA, variant 3 [uncultured Paludibacter sp.]|uniref:HAD-superfamily hydrolase, subfamily IA, variant 3 n=1 Tax=uncultured Paludibacter sp. TaxID=497635 RepID=A0A653A6U3_9BACT|nr:HAD-superfamily hydrolase, subfamily IA, variant 3 [uncultured Paludibacter sp.]